MSSKTNLSFSLTVSLLSIFLTVAFLDSAMASLTCAEAYRSSERAVSEPGRYLRELEEYLRKNSNNHKLVGSPDSRTLEINVLKRKEREFAILAYRAILEGSLHHIETGPVIGPKVLALISRLMQVAVDNNLNLRISGLLSPGIFHKQYTLQRQGKAEENDPKYWHKQEIEDYEKAKRVLGIENCKYYLCKFEFQVENQTIKLDYSKPPNTDSYPYNIGNEFSGGPR